MALLPATMWVLFLFLSLMAYTKWFQLILTSFGRYVIPAGHFPQKNLSRNPRIGFPLYPPLDHAHLPLIHDPPLPILAKYRLVVSRPCACSTFVYIQNLPTAHAFAMVYRLVYTYCHPSLTSYGLSYFLTSYSLWPTPFGGWALLDCGLFFLQSTLLLFFAILLPFLTVPFCYSCCDVIWPKPTGPL